MRVIYLLQLIGLILVPAAGSTECESLGSRGEPVLENGIGKRRVRDCCPSLSHPTNGLVECTYYTEIDSVATFTCYEGYYLSSIMSRTCLSNETWNNTSPTCNITNCGSLESPDNGLVIYTNGTTYQSIASFSCYTGFTLSANLTRTCEASANWSDFTPNCSKNDCGNLTSPNDGLVIYSNGTTYQSKATFSCNTGYTLSANSTRTCEASTDWSGLTPNCIKNDCDNLTSPDYGFVIYSNGTTYQSKATFNCTTGYTLSANSTRACEASTNWSGLTPNCIKNDCGNLTSPDDGFVIYSNGTTYQSKATFSCKTGYTLSANSTRACEASTNWSGLTPNCIKNDCGTLTNPENGNITYVNGTTYLSVATFTCGSGYTISLCSTRTCMADETVSNTTPNCIINDCGSLTGLDNGNITYSNGTTYMSVASFICNHGYTESSTSTRTCMSDKTWSKTTPQCIINDCGALTSLGNGYITYSNKTKYLSVASFSCNPGYTKSSSLTRMCMADKTWSNETPYCSINNCGQMKIPDNGFVIYLNGTTYESVVLFDCNSGYTITANVTRTCQADASWSNTSPSCYINDCGNLTSPENGSLRYSAGTTYQSVASFSCNTGYTTSANSTRTCKADKTWSNVTPYCTINDCDKLTSPENGVLRYSNGTTYQSVATFSCNPGYKISTNLTRTCKADKTWSNVIPSCIINDCGSLTSPENGSVRYSTGTTYQSVASFNCSTGYTISTHSTRTCKADKTWSNVTPYCTIKALACVTLTSPENGSLRYSAGTTYQSVASFSCNTGYTISANLTRTCKADKTWSNVTPYCTINDCGTIAPLQHGFISCSSGTTYMSVATFSCDQGYTLSHTTNRTCQANKIWNNDSPFCISNSFRSTGGNFCMNFGMVIAIIVGTVCGVIVLSGVTYTLVRHLSANRVYPKSEGHREEKSGFGAP